jgi:hypothetical protein
MLPVDHERWESSCKFRLLPADRNYHKGQSRDNNIIVLILCKGRRDRMVHTTNVASLSPARGNMYSIQHCVIKFVS